MIILGILCNLIGFFLAFWLPKRLIPPADELRCGTISKIEKQKYGNRISVLLLSEDRENFDEYQVEESKKYPARKVGDYMNLRITDTGFSIYYPDKKWRYFGYLMIAAGGLMCIFA